MNRTITAIQSSKGGVGKTTSTAILGSICAISGQRVLIIDMDYQRNLTDLMIQEGQQMPEVTLSELVLNPLKPEEVMKAVIPTKVPGVSLIPADEDIHGLHYLIHDEVTHNGNESVVFHLRNNLLSVTGSHFDKVFIDTSPALTYLSTVITVAAGVTLIPIESDNLNTQSIINILAMLDQTRDYYNIEEPKHGYVFMTRVQSRTTRFREMTNGYTQLLGDIFLPIYIKSSEVVGRANTSFTPLLFTDRKCETINEYISLLQALDYLNGEQFMRVKKYQRDGKQIIVEEESKKA